jgi:hypothetical protein
MRSTGRSFVGWHHHVTLVLVCYAFLVAQHRAILSPLGPSASSRRFVRTRGLSVTSGTRSSTSASSSFARSSCDGCRAVRAVCATSRRSIAHALARAGISSVNPTYPRTVAHATCERVICDREHERDEPDRVARGTQYESVNALDSPRCRGRRYPDAQGVDGAETSANGSATCLTARRGSAWARSRAGAFADHIGAK